MERKVRRLEGLRQLGFAFRRAEAGAIQSSPDEAGSFLNAAAGLQDRRDAQNLHRLARKVFQLSGVGCRSGRQRIPPDLQRLIRKMARENRLRIVAGVDHEKACQRIKVPANRIAH